ncbi:hypothetical protein Ade02nite_18520 [Paractinoplanes deccanensis]|uniref:Uncharacterized protein n=1 Tax=Paractinoplanes deccanensis TaxID=113561 RepID=A0ABQ3XZP1_9ACTN|nr:hypothetical protein [Actinoplanes deccanensis]GID73211.1 hypothetical protein Ade02nite_18520 [Actinoplanes deccanensis]
MLVLMCSSSAISAFVRRRGAVREPFDVGEPVARRRGRGHVAIAQRPEASATGRQTGSAGFLLLVTHRNK